jgi:uncharacterized repeat protein (TIGR01451 family)
MLVAQPAKDIEIAELLDPLEQFTDPSSTNPPVSEIIGNVLVWNIGMLNPGEFKLFTYRVTIAPSVAIGDLVKGQAFEVCDQCRNTDPCHFLRTVCDFFSPDLIPTGGGLKDIFERWWNKHFPSKECSGTALLCAEECKTRCPHASHDQSSQGPTDPNEKLVVAKRFVRLDQTLVYSIHFENIGTVEARDVFVTDVLDPALDEATLNIITSQGASFDSSTRTLRWDLLNVNLPPGEAGNVLFAVRPHQNTLSGTVIRNKATIQFEVFEKMDTNEVVNIIDSTRPACTVNPLPAQISTLSFPLSWNGTDEVGEIASYSILVSVDGGNFTAFLEKTSTTSATFTGELGRTYAFLCVATDTTGNIEVQAPVAEAVTHLSAIIFRGFFQPVDNLPILNVTKAGSGVPVKFNLNGNQGLNILVAGYPVSQKIACDSSAPQAAIEQTVTAGSSGLTYDATTDTYTYTWKTDKTWAGTCRQLHVKLNDGSDHIANFKFR